jgi:ankyrin repeat protein
MGELAPVPLFLSLNPKTAALWCMNIYGEYAVFATPFEYQSPMPIPRPLRTTTLLHLNAQRGDIAVVDKCLDSGTPIDVLANDGFAPLHWALLSSKPEMASHLIDRGSPVDVRSDDGATALMMVIQSRSIEMCRLLLERGADPNDVDHRGFSSLHRACEMGQLEIVQMLLSRGARKDLVALGLTARDLAVKRNETKVIELLDRA